MHPHASHASPPAPPLLQNLAGGLPDIAAALGKVSLPTIPVVGFDLDEITRAVGDATDSLQTLLDNGGSAGRVAGLPSAADPMR